MSLPLDNSIDRSVSPLRELLYLAIPTVLQMTSYTIDQFADAFMLSKVSDIAATACVNSGMVTFCVISFGFGILMLINALVSQSFGAQRHHECGPYLWQGVWLSVAYSAVMMPTMLLARPLFERMGHPAEMVPMEVDYFNISIVLLVLKMLVIALGQFVLAVNRPNLVLLSAAIGSVFNIFVNWLLIYGNWGFPMMGVAGAAWGTNVAAMLEVLILGSVVFGPAMRKQFNTLAFRFEMAKFKELLRVGVPSGFQTAGDVIAWTVFLAVVMALFTPAAMAANGYMLQYMKISFMPAFGLSTAVTALVARYVGAGRPDISEHRAHLGFKVAMVYMLSCGLMFFLFRNQLMHLFSSDPEVIRLGGTLLIICAIFQIFDAMFIIYIGALRGVKDTFVPSIVQISLCWGLVVGGGWLVAKAWPQFGIVGPWTVGIIYGFILGSYLMMRFRSGRWKTMQPESEAEAQRFDLASATAVEPIGK